MVHKKNKGMWLQQAAHSGDDKFNWLMHMLTAMLAYVVLILNITKLTGFQELYGLTAMLATGLVLCFLYGVLQKFQMHGWFYPGVLLFLLVFVLIYRQAVLEGVRLFWNQMGDYKTLGTGFSVPELEILNLDKNSSLLRFSILTGGLIALICSFINSCMSVLMPGLLFVGLIWFGSQLSVEYLLITLCSAIVLLLASGKKGKNIPGAMILSCLLAGIFASAFIAAASLPQAKTFAANLSEQMHEAVHKYKYETNYTTLPEGDFRNYIENTTEAKVLSVTMDDPQPLYLRGFTGCTFEENVWKPLETENLAKNEDLLYWLNLNEFYPDTQFAAATVGMKTERKRITVQNTGACSKYYYVPFGLLSGDYLQPENLNEAGVYGYGERTYTYSAISSDSQMITEVLEHLQTDSSEEVLDYRKAESAYRGFVYSHYLEVSQEVKELLEEDWKQISSRYGVTEKLSAEQAQECTLLFLSGCFTEDGVSEKYELPLEAAAGSSYQYATVAAMTLRYYGIPARYAEGYIITEDMAADAQNGATIKIDGSHASAWVEVYQDGIGWIPMNLTPGLGEMTEEEPEPDQSNGAGSSDKSDVKEGEELEETPEEENQSEDPENGFMTSLLKMIQWTILLIILLLLLLILILVLRRKYLLKQKEKKFCSENRKDAAAWIFADTVLLMEKMGLDRGNGSMQGLMTPTEQRFGEEYAKQLQEMIDLNAVAMFSSHEIDESQREEALNFRCITIQHLQQESKWLRRLWLKWILCLY